MCEKEPQKHLAPSARPVAHSISGKGTLVKVRLFAESVKLFTEGEAASSSFALFCCLMVLRSNSLFHFSATHLPYK